MDKEKLVKEYLNTIAKRLSVDYDVPLDKACELVEELDLINLYKDAYDFLLHEDISAWADVAYRRYVAGIEIQLPEESTKVAKILFEGLSKEENVASEEKMQETLENSFAYTKSIILNDNVLEKPCKEVKLNNRLEEGKEALKGFKPMAVCDCYFEQEVVDSFLYDRRLVGRCNGTKERDVCQCCGNPAMCDFYPEKREEARRQTQEYRDKKELEFYRTWIKEHNLEEPAEKAFKEWERNK